MKCLLCLVAGLLSGYHWGLAQTTHPLLQQMLEKARAVDYGSYRIVAREHYPYSTDTIVYRGRCAFSRFEHFDGKPGIRYDVDMETRQPRQSPFQERMVFDGMMKYDFRSDTLVMLYDSREVDEDYIMRGLQYFFFIPMLLHPGQVQKFLIRDKYLGKPPYETLPDTLIGGTPCHLVGADWAVDTASTIWEHIRFGINANTGLPVYFSHTEETLATTKNQSTQRRGLEIQVEDWTPELPVNSFYVDWTGLPATFEVRHFHDCYNRELLRSRNQTGL